MSGASLRKPLKVIHRPSDSSQKKIGATAIACHALPPSVIAEDVADDPGGEQRRSDESEHRDRTRDEAGLVHEPAEQGGIEGRDAGPQGEGPIAHGDERVLDGDEDGCLGSARARLLQGDDRQDAHRPDHEDCRFEQATGDEADREALVLALHDGVERDRGPDGGEAVDDVEEGAEADLFGAAAADDEVRIGRGPGPAGRRPGSS